MLRVVADVAELSTPYAISGLAGAAFVRRTVEPSEVLLLTTKDGIRRWSELLLADRAPTGQGRLRLTAVEDDFIFRVARPEGNLVIADPVQLWLDTSSSGERAREASEAIAEAMGW